MHQSRLPKLQCPASIQKFSIWSLLSELPSGNPSKLDFYTFQSKNPNPCIFQVAMWRLPQQPNPTPSPSPSLLEHLQNPPPSHAYPHYFPPLHKLCWYYIPPVATDLKSMPESPCRHLVNCPDAQSRHFPPSCTSQFRNYDRRVHKIWFWESYWSFNNDV